MLKLHIAGKKDAVVQDMNDPLPDNVTWFDLNDPDADEVRMVEKAIDVELPERGQISGLGLASSYHDREKMVQLHLALYDDQNQEMVKVPTGVVATHDKLVTVQFEHCSVMNAASKQVRENAETTGIDAFATLLETAINESAQQMQEIANNVGDLSARIFNGERMRTYELHDLMLRVGQLESHLARYRTSLLGVARMVDFINHQPPEWMPKPVLERLEVLGNDLQTLDMFDEQLTSKLQFLLDSILGFINSVQNGTMRLLTVASVAAVPPVILGAIWGMNFKHMPELAPVWGYPLALTLIVISMALPLWLFYRRGWLSRN